MHIKFFGGEYCFNLETKVQVDHITLKWKLKGMDCVSCKFWSAVCSFHVLDIYWRLMARKKRVNECSPREVTRQSVLKGRKDFFFFFPEHGAILRNLFWWEIFFFPSQPKLFWRPGFIFFLSKSMRRMTLYRHLKVFSFSGGWPLS